MVSERFQYRTQLAIATLSVGAIVVHLLLHFGTTASQTTANVPLWIALTLGGVPLIWELVVHIFRGEFGADLIAGVSIVSAVVLGQYLAGTLVVLMLSGGEALEAYAVRSASSVLNALARRMPTIAHRKRQVTIDDVPLAQITVGDVVLQGNACDVCRRQWHRKILRGSCDSRRSPHQRLEKLHARRWQPRATVVVNWPGTTPAGRVNNDLIDLSDFFVTIAELAGAELPRGVTLDGHSFAPQIRGAKGSPRDWVYVELNGKSYVRDSRFKLTNDGQMFDLTDAPLKEQPVGRHTNDRKTVAARQKLQAVLESHPAAPGRRAAERAL